MARGTRHAPPATLPTTLFPCLDHLTPERRLWLAVLEIAIADLATTRRSQVLAWFESRQTTPGSLRWIADVLGLDRHRLCTAIRRGVVLPVMHSWSGEAHRIEPPHRHGR